jgi:hypothetical protein
MADIDRDQFPNCRFIFDDQDFCVHARIR